MRDHRITPYQIYPIMYPLDLQFEDFVELLSVDVMGVTCQMISASRLKPAS